MSFATSNWFSDIFNSLARGESEEMIPYLPHISTCAIYKVVLDQQLRIESKIHFESKYVICKPKVVNK